MSANIALVFQQTRLEKLVKKQQKKKQWLNKNINIFFKK